MYNMWKNEIEKTINHCFPTKKKKKEKLKSTRILKKRSIRNVKDNRRKKNMRENINAIMEAEIRKERAQKTIKTAKMISDQGKLDTTKFWDFKKHMDLEYAKETPSTINDKNGVEKCTKDEILNVFTEFYQDLFKPTKAESKLE